MSHTPKPTQQSRILDVLESIRAGVHEIPDIYLRHHPSGDGVSARYFKQVLFISECNGRISELRGKGHVIETSEAKDEYGFVYHRLRPGSAPVAVKPPVEEEKKPRTRVEYDPIAGHAVEIRLS